jgi:hypothetical protein
MRLHNANDDDDYVDIDGASAMPCWQKKKQMDTKHTNA